VPLAVQLVVTGAVSVLLLSCHCARGVREFFESGLHPLDKAMEVPHEEVRDLKRTRRAARQSGRKDICSLGLYRLC